MRWHAPLLFCAIAAFFACAHVEPGNEPDSELNSPRCVTDIECGRDQRCFKEEKRPDGICAPKGSVPVETTAPSEPPPQRCTKDKDCSGKACSKKMHGKSATCVFCDGDAHVCRTMTTSP